MRRFTIGLAVVGMCGAAAIVGVALAGRAPAVPEDNPTVSEGGQVLALDVFAQREVVDMLTFEEAAGGRELRHRRSIDGGATWGASTTIDRGGRGIVSHHPGMDPQIAAEGDTVLVLWTQPGTSAWGEGALATAISLDGGRRWVDGVNPADDGSNDGHAFLELVADGHGTFQALWLDSRDGAQGVRGAASVDGGRTWSANTSIDTRTCECCWNKALALGPATFALLYRDTDPRDMALAVSEDDGRRWRRTGSVGAFNWTIEACPHVGGGLARTVDGSTAFLHATVWTGADGHVGAHVLRSADGGVQWSAPTRIGSEGAKHTDIAATEAILGVVWDERRPGESVIMGAISRDHGLTWTAPVQVSAGGLAATHPRLIAAAGRLTAFWTERPRETGVTLTWRSATLAE